MTHLPFVVELFVYHQLFRVERSNERAKLLRTAITMVPPFEGDEPTDQQVISFGQFDRLWRQFVVARAND